MFFFFCAPIELKFPTTFFTHLSKIVFDETLEINVHMVQIQDDWQLKLPFPTYIFHADFHL